MYTFYYEVVAPFFNKPGEEKRLRTLYMHTDSFVFHIVPGNQPFHQELYNLQRQFDCLDLSEIQDPKHPLLTFEGSDGKRLDAKANAKVLGKFKDETKGISIKEFIALRPKM